MSNEDIVKLIQKGINTQENLGMLYLNNERYIRKIAMHYDFLTDIDDLMQEGYFGLTEAVNRYEDTAGVKFMTYARFWIRRAMKRYIETYCKTVSIPKNLQSDIYRYKKIISVYQKTYGRKPTDQELCSFLNLTYNALEKLKRVIHTFEDIESLESQIPGSDDLVLGDAVADGTDLENDIIDKMMDKRLKSELWQIVKENTSENENQVLKLRFKDDMTLQAIGNELGVTREWVRQIEAKAIRKLRLSRVTRQLKEKYEINYATAYRSSYAAWKNEWESAPERIAIRNIEAEEHYKKTVSL